GTKRERRVAVLERCAKLIENGANPAAIVQGFRVLGIAADHLVEIGNRPPVLTLLGVDLAALEVSLFVVGVALDRLVEIVQPVVGGQLELGRGLGGRFGHRLWGWRGVFEPGQRARRGFGTVSRGKSSHGVAWSRPGRWPRTSGTAGP